MAQRPPGASFAHFGCTFGHVGHSFAHFYAFLAGFREHLCIFAENSWKPHKNSANCSKIMNIAQEHRKSA